MNVSCQLHAGATLIQEKEPPPPYPFDSKKLLSSQKGNKIFQCPSVMTD